jgi:murein DD-endopeptidase MepM/ murein hydrolase activator NlpD
LGKERGCRRMDKKAYTVIILSQQAAKAKKFLISALALRIAAALLGILILVFAFVIYDYRIYHEKVTDLHRLQAESDFQQGEIRAFLGKITALEEELKKLADMERQMEGDLREVNELRKSNKRSPVRPTPEVTKKGSTEDISSGAEEISILEGKRPWLISHLNQDLLVLRKQALRREQSLQEFGTKLQVRKSVLLATPSMWPVAGQISSRFGDTRLNFDSGGPRPHRGVDISAPPGTPIVAPADGVIRFAGYGLDLGRLIIIDHGYGFSTKYGHLKKYFVQTGDKVRKGQTIGAVGSSGSSTGPHLHYEVHIHDRAVNPADYLKQKP